MAYVAPLVLGRLSNRIHVRRRGENVAITGFGCVAQVSGEFSVSQQSVCSPYTVHAIKFTSQAMLFYEFKIGQKTKRDRRENLVKPVPGSRRNKGKRKAFPDVQ